MTWRRLPDNCFDFLFVSFNLLHYLFHAAKISLMWSKEVNGGRFYHCGK